MKGTAVNVGTTAVRIWPPASGTRAVAGHVDQPTSVLIKHPSGGTATIYIGGADVNNTGGDIGFQLSAGEAISVDLVQDAIYAISSSGTQQIFVVATN